jgi:hypothetical protein
VDSLPRHQTPVAASFQRTFPVREAVRKPPWQLRSAGAMPALDCLQGAKISPAERRAPSREEQPHEVDSGKLRRGAVCEAFLMARASLQCGAVSTVKFTWSLPLPRVVFQAVKSPLRSPPGWGSSPAQCESVVFGLNGWYGLCV